MAVEKIKILGAILELPAKQHCQFSPFTSKLGKIGQIGSAVIWELETAPRFLIFFNYHGCQLFILWEIHCYLCPYIFGYIISVLASVDGQKSLTQETCSTCRACSTAWMNNNEWYPIILLILSSPTYLHTLNWSNLNWYWRFKEFSYCIKIICHLWICI